MMAQEVAAAGSLIIDAFRLRGPMGANDEYVQIYNDSGAAHTVAAVSGAGYAVAASNGVVRCLIPNGTVIPARGHYLCVNSVGYSLASYPSGSGATATGDATYTTDIPDNAGIALFNNNAGGADFNLANRFDAVGSTAEANPLYKEGTGYPALTPFSIDYSWVRDACGKGGAIANFDPCPGSGTPIDTDDNAADFYFVDTNGTSAGGGQRLGSPGPQNLASPIFNGSTLGQAALDPCLADTAAPNVVRNTTSDPANNSTFGTIDVRRTFTNNTGAPITRLRFRVMDITTFPAPSGIVDLRTRTSSSLFVTVDRAPCGAGTSNLFVQGTMIEQPPSQPNGGAFYGSFSVGAVSPGTPLAPGASIDVRFLFGLQQMGNYRVALVAETIPPSGAVFQVQGCTSACPSVASITRVDSDPTGAASVQYTVTFSEAVNGVDAADFALTTTGAVAGASVSGLAGGPTVYTVTVNTGMGDGTLRLDLVDNDSIRSAAGTIPLGGGGTGNGNFSAGEVYTLDKTAPTVTLDQAAAQADPTAASPIDFTVTFSEPVAGFTAADVTLGGTAGATMAVVTGGPTVYNVAVSGMTANGTVTAGIFPGAATDAVGNPSTASASTDNTVTFNGMGPLAVTIDQAAGQTDPAAASPIHFTVTFNRDVTGFDSTDVTLGGTAGATTAVVTGGPSVYDVAVSGMVIGGTVTATVAAGVAVDAGATPNVASTSTDNSVTFTGLPVPVTSFTAPTATGTGSATASFTGGGATCTFSGPQFIAAPPGAAPVPPSAPSGVHFPHGLFDFSTTGCAAGSTLAFTIVYPQPLPPGTQYWKYGPTGADPVPHWYVLPATIAGNTVTFSITDGGLGDDDLAANGTIVDQGGPGAPAGTAVPVPTLGIPALMLLMLMLLGVGTFSMRRRM